MLNVLMDSIICGFELYMLFDFGKSILGLNNKILIHRVVVNLLFFIGHIIINSLDSSTINFVAVPIIYIIFALLNFSGELLKKITISICYYAFLILPEFLFTILLNENSEFYYRANSGDKSLIFIMMLVMKIVTFILIKSVEQIHRHRYYGEKKGKVFISLLVLPIATIILLGGIFYSDIIVSSIKARSIIIFGIILLFFSNIFMFHLFDSILLNMDKAQKLEHLYIISDMEKKRLEQLNKADEERKVLLHDINNYIRIAASFVAMGNVQEALKIFDKLSIKIKVTKSAEFCRDKIVNVIINDRKQYFQDKRIALNVKMDFDIDFTFMEEVDVIAIFGNLLDNAYEAAQQCGKQGFTNLKIFTENDGHFLIINIENNYKVPLQIKNNIYETTKKDKKKHGIGLYSVEKIVESYGGKIEIKTKEERIFSVMIIFQR